MAKLLRVSVGHYRKIERGVYGLDVEKLVILYEKLDVDPLYLLAGRQKGKTGISGFTSCDTKPQGV